MMFYVLCVDKISNFGSHRSQNEFVLLLDTPCSVAAPTQTTAETGEVFRNVVIFNFDICFFLRSIPIQMR